MENILQKFHFQEYNVEERGIVSWTIAEKLLKRERLVKGEGPGIDANLRPAGRGRSGCLCDTATSITVRRPTLSLSRDPDQHGGRRGSTLARTDTEKRSPRTLGRTFGVLVRRERTRGRARKGGEGTWRHTYLIVSCVVPYEPFKVQSWRQPGR